VAPITVARTRTSSLVRVFARFGYATRGSLYALLGGLACRYAVTGRGRADFAGTLTELHAAAGSSLLIAAAIGLWGYALWRFVEAIRNPEGRSLWSRQDIAIRGAMHGWLGATAAHFAVVHWTEPQPVRQWVITAFTYPLGNAVVFAAGLGLLWFSWSEARLAQSGVITRHLDGSDVSRQGLEAIHYVGRLGMVGRAVAFGLVAVALVRASFHAFLDVDLADIFAQLCATVPGRFMVFGVGLALAAYGMYLGALASHRRVPA